MAKNKRKKRGSSWRASNDHHTKHRKKLDETPVKPGDHAFIVAPSSAARPMIEPLKRVVAVDPAWPGGDESVTAIIEDGKIVELSASDALRAMPPTSPPWNTRYLEYARAHGTSSPTAMLARDEQKYPGGRMAGFILWIGRRWEDWRWKNGRNANDPLTQADQDSFDAWLKDFVDAVDPNKIVAPPPPKIAGPS